MLIRKRTGVEEEFDKSKIQLALTKANDSLNNEKDKLDKETILKITNDISEKAAKYESTPTVEDIQDLVEREICKRNKCKLFKEYVIYRYEHTSNREEENFFKRQLAIVNGNNEEVKGDNANKNPILLSTQRDYMAGTVSKEIYQKILLPQDIAQAHKEGIIHQHDADYSIQKMHNCDLADLLDMLWNGTVINGKLIERPHSFSTSCNIGTQVIAQLASSQFGGQTVSLAHLVPFVDISRQNIKKEVLRESQEIGIEYTQEQINKIVALRLQKEVTKGVQTIQYQVETIMSTNGQAPFISLAMFRNDIEDVARFCKLEDKIDQLNADFNTLVEEVLRQRIEGIKIEDGTTVSPVFPKLIYCIDSTCCDESTPNWYLTELAAECTTKRMVPDYVSEKVMKELRGEAFSSMGCRSQTSVWYLKDHPEFIKQPKQVDERGYVLAINNKWYDPNKMIKYSRFNIGVTTINLPDIALSAYATKKDIELGKQDNFKKFWEIFDERLELCHRAIRFRFDYLCGTKAKVAPILWQYGALARLNAEDTIDELMKNGFATASLGYVGLYETVKWLTGESHTQEYGKEIGMQIMKKLHDICDIWKQSEPEHIGYSLYGTPEEQTTEKFAKALQRRHGIIEGITDKLYVTNSYHIPVFEGISHGIDAFTKLTKEAPFQDLSSGGNISYVEVPAMNKNIGAMIAIIKHIYNTNIYAEINTKLDYCKQCGYEGEILLVDDVIPQKYKWKCPNCGNTDTNTMYIVRRICGYLASMSTGSNMGRLGDIHDRECHL